MNTRCQRPVRTLGSRRWLIAFAVFGLAAACRSPFVDQEQVCVEAANAVWFSNIPEEADNAITDWQELSGDEPSGELRTGELSEIVALRRRAKPSRERVQCVMAADSQTALARCKAR